MKYLFFLASLTAILSFVGKTEAKPLSINLQPEIKLIKSQMCRNCDGEFTGVGNTCIQGEGNCMPNPCPGCDS